MTNHINMFPRNASDSLLESNVSDSQFQNMPDFFDGIKARGVEASGLNNYLRVKNGVLLACEEFSGCSLSPNHVVIVLFFSTAVKVIRAHARRIVAVMQHAKASGDHSPVVYLPRKLMGGNVVEGAVAVIVGTRDPYPALIPDFNLSPKAPKLIAMFASVGPLWLTRTVSKFFQGFNQKTIKALSLVYDGVSQDRNLREQVSFWLGSRECNHTLTGRYILSLFPIQQEV